MSMDHLSLPKGALGSPLPLPGLEDEPNPAPGAELGASAPSADPHGAPVFETFVAMEPRGKGRHRMTRSGHSYADPKTASAEQLVKLKIAAEWTRAPLDEPLRVQVVAYFERPKSKPKRIIFPTGKPDWDNIGKLACDALNGMLWRDDSVIVDGQTLKRYCTQDQPRPGVLIRVWRL